HAAIALARRPEKEIVIQKSLAIGLPVRVENRLAVARPARRSDVAAVRQLQGEERLAWQWLRAHRRDVLRIALEHLLDALCEFLLLRICADGQDDELRFAF